MGEGVMWKPVDYQCQNCGCDHEETVWIPHGGERPAAAEFVCPYCGIGDDGDGRREHHAIMGLPAPYMGEKILNPPMYGGTYDTMGAREMQDLPDLPGQAEHSAKLRKAMAALPDTATSEERKAVFGDACKDAPSSADYASLFKTPEYKEAERANKQIATENAAKRKRAKAIAKGENVNMRRDKCPGDPNVTA